MSRVRWKLSRTVLRGGTGGNVGPLLDKAAPGGKVPHHFTMTDGAVFAFAGLWEAYGDVECVATLTTEPNGLVSPVHDRMPVILPPEAQRVWLSDADTDTLRALIVPYPPELMTVRLVSKAVGSVKTEGPQCLEAAPPAQLAMF